MTLKWIALACLVVQNSSLALLMRSTFLHKAEGHIYLASTAVLITECIKLLLSVVFCYVLDGKSNFKQFQGILTKEVFTNKWDWINLTVPSLLYTLQNSLQYLSMSLLSAPVFQLLYQMKIVTTAIFSVLMLSKRISIPQWIAIIGLSCGVALVQLSQNNIAKPDEQLKENSLVGLVSVLCGCVTSGFAGVYFEWILKASPTSLWVRNIQLSTIGVGTSLAACLWRDWHNILSLGFFVGYNHKVWGVISLQAAGGLIVAIVVKFADNVLKVFATSLSILVSSFVSWQLLGDFQVTSAFVVGSSVVLTSVMVFSSGGQTQGVAALSIPGGQLKVLSSHGKTVTT